MPFGVDIKLLDPPLMYKINTYNISGVKNQVVILSLKQCKDQLCMNVPYVEYAGVDPMVTR